METLSMAAAGGVLFAVVYVLTAMLVRRPHGGQ
jgi:hypothetical protein